jgi:hypothetical protein
MAAPRKKIPLVGTIILLLVAGLHAQTIQFNPADQLKVKPTGQVSSAKPSTDRAAVASVAQAYLYIEPYQTRFEYLMDASRVLGWLDPEKELPHEISPELKQDILHRLSRQADSWCRLTTGSGRVEGGLTTVALVMGRPGDTRPPPEKESIAVSGTMIGFIWEFATPPSPDEIFVDWTGFISGVRSLPVRVFFGNSSETLEIASYLPKLAWKSEGRVPLPLPLAEIPEIQILPPTIVPLATMIWVLGAAAFIGLLKYRRRPIPGGAMPWVATISVGAALTWPLVNLKIGGGAQVPEIKNSQHAEVVLTPLLRNIYRAFDRRDEEEIYDVLERSVEGELLRRLYLETIEALTLDGREGARVTISEFSVEVKDVSSAPTNSGFVAECQWTALGKVGHWGHSHTRVNRYTAKVTVSPIGSDWKMTDLTVLEARRI